VLRKIAMSYRYFGMASILNKSAYGSWSSTAPLLSPESSLDIWLGLMLHHLGLMMTSKENS
jgi:hypothetical protein